MQALATPHNRTLTFMLLAASGALALGGAAVGVSDNPPGLLLAFLAAVALVLTFVHPWRTERAFRILFFSSFLFVVLAEIAEKFEKVSGAAAEAGFVAGVVLFPAAFLIGLIGWIAISIRNRRARAHS